MERIKTLYSEISEILGTEEPMERLNAVIKKTFLSVPATTSSAQAIADSAVLSLLYNELESGKFAFELPIDIAE